MILELIGLLIAAASSVALVVMLVFTIIDVIEWFSNRNNIVAEEEDNIAFTLQEKLQTGQYKTVQGIFNKRTNTLVDARKVQSKTVDEELAKHHNNNQLVIYS